MWSAVDLSTQRANAAGNHVTFHGFAFIRAVVTCTDATATTDTKPTTNTNITPTIFPYAEPVA